MAELPPRPRLLAVQVNVRSGNREQALARRDSSDEVDHDAPTARLGRAERETEDRAQVILELARLGTVDRPVARCCARAERTRSRAAPRRRRRARPRARRRSRARRGAASRSPPPHAAAHQAQAPRHGEDPAAVLVLGERIEGGLARRAPHRDDRQLALELDDSLRQLVLSERLGAATTRWPLPS